MENITKFVPRMRTVNGLRWLLDFDLFQAWLPSVPTENAIHTD